MEWRPGLGETTEVSGGHGDLPPPAALVQSGGGDWARRWDQRGGEGRAEVACGVVGDRGEAEREGR